MLGMEAKELIAKIGRKPLADALGVSETTVRLAVYQGAGQLPPSWFDACDRLARAKRVKCPRDLFSFKLASSQEATA